MNAAVRMPQRSCQIGTLIALIDEMVLIITAENAELAAGLPASRSKFLGRKTELAGLFEQWVADVKSRKVSLTAEHEPLRSLFAERIQLLQMLMDENVIKLRAAIEASQMRIDAVMRAVRERVTSSSPYAADGRWSRQVVSCSSGVQA